MSNARMRDISPGSLFQFGHDRDGSGFRWIKISNEYSRSPGSFLPEPNTVPGVDAATLPVTYLGRGDDCERAIAQ